MNRLQLALSSVLILIVAVPAAGQSNNDLRRENERLRTEVRELQSELNAARARIAELERDLERAAAAPSRAPRPGLGDEVDDAVTMGDPADGPEHHPGLLLLRLQEEYAEAMGDHAPGAHDSRERDRYHRALSRWYFEVNRRRHHVIWPVRVLQHQPATRAGKTFRLQVVQHDDPEVVYGDPFEVVMSRSTAHRFMRMQERDPDDRPRIYVLRANLSPTLLFNEDRYEPGPFDNPRFVGLFTEFDFALDIRAFLPREEAERLLREKSKRRESGDDTRSDEDDETDEEEEERG